jgi:hypothetical protein
MTKFQEKRSQGNAFPFYRLTASGENCQSSAATSTVSQAGMEVALSQDDNESLT